MIMKNENIRSIVFLLIVICLFGIFCAGIYLILKPYPKTLDKQELEKIGNKFKDSIDKAKEDTLNDPNLASISEVAISSINYHFDMASSTIRTQIIETNVNQVLVNEKILIIIMIERVVGGILLFPVTVCFSVSLSVFFPISYAKSRKDQANEKTSTIKAPKK